MGGETDRERRVRLLGQREVPERDAARTPDLDELAALVASQRDIQQRLDDWIEAASAAGREVGERIGGLERLGRQAMAAARRGSSDVSARLHAIVADERVRRAEHARMMEDCALKAEGFDRARLAVERLAVERLAASQSRWAAAACASGGASLLLAAVLGWVVVAE